MISRQEMMPDETKYNSKLYHSIMKALLITLLCTLPLWSFKPASLPPTNQKVIDYVKTVVGKKVDRGECWDLANAALTYAHAKWEFPTKFGKEVNWKKGEEILPGDIMQMENVTMEEKTETMVTRWSMAEHTAIAYEVKGKTQLRIAEQNFNKIRTVSINPIDLANLVKGRITVYRPQPM
jgi:hypothetical protein